MARAYQSRRSIGDLPSLPRAGLSRDEVHRYAVDAVTLAGRLGTVREDMAQMPAAIGAVHFGARVADLVVGAGPDRAGQSLPEAGPAGARIVFGFGRIQLVAAACADERARALFVIERARYRAAPSPLRAARGTRRLSISCATRLRSGEWENPWPAPRCRHMRQARMWLLRIRQRQERNGGWCDGFP